MLCIERFTKVFARSGNPVARVATAFLGCWGSAAAQAPAEAEYYDEFILLPAGAASPDTVPIRNDGLPARGAPILCGVASAEDDGADAMNASPINVSSEPSPSLETAMALLAYPRELIDRLRTMLSLDELDAVEIIRYDTGELHSVSVSFRPPGVDEQGSYPFMRLAMDVEFPRPFPIWDTEAVWDESPRARKVDFLAIRGLLKKTGPNNSYPFYWISNDTLYTLSVEGAVSVGGQSIEGTIHSIISLFNTQPMI